MVNRVTLLGNLGQDPVLKNGSGTPVTTFSVATHRRYKDRDGKRQEVTDWHNAVCFGRQAEIAGVWVADAFRHTGLDAMLIDHALGRAADLGCDDVHVLADGARSGRHSFWERAGFIHMAAGYVRAVVERPRLRRIS